LAHLAHGFLEGQKGQNVFPNSHVILFFLIILSSI